MPPKGKLKDEAIADLVTWVDMGAPWPSGPSDALASADSASEAHAKHWAFQPVTDPTPPEVRGPRLAPRRDRPVRAGEARGQGAHAVARGRQADADPPRDVRPDRPPPDPRGGRGLRGRRVARRLRAAGRPPARLAAVRRALGEALARRGPVCRHQGLCPLPGRELPLVVHLSRLRHPRVQRRPPLRPVRRAADRRRPAPARRGQAPAGGPGVPDARRAVHGQPSRRHRRPDRRRDAGADGPDRHLRPLPRPQVRPDPHGRLLLAVRGLRQLDRAPRPADLPGASPDRGIRPLREGDEGARAAPRGIRHREARRGGPLGPLPRGRIPGDGAGDARPARHRGIHAARRRRRPEPQDGPPLAGLSGADRPGARCRLLALARAGETARGRLRGEGRPTGRGPEGCSTRRSTRSSRGRWPISPPGRWPRPPRPILACSTRPRRSGRSTPAAPR